MPIDADLAGLADMRKAVYDPNMDNKIAAANIAADLTHANIADRTKFIFLDANAGKGTCDFGISNQSQVHAALLDASGLEYVSWNIKMPDGLVSLEKLFIVYVDWWFTGADGDIVWNCRASYGAKDEAVTDLTDLTNVLTLLNDTHTSLIEVDVDLSSVIKDDYMGISIERDGANAADHAVSDWEIKGVLLEVIIDM